MKRNLKSLSLLCLALVMCLAGVGVGYGHWSETIDIEGTATVEFLMVEIVEQETNDPRFNPFTGDEWVSLDESIMPGFTGAPFRLNKDVGWTECELFDTDDDGYRDTCEFRIHNAYPCYFGKLELMVMNLGDQWVKVNSVDVIYPDSPEYNWSSPPTMSAPFPHPEAFELKWTNGAWNLPILVPPGETTHLGCYAHVLQPAEQGAEYRFQIVFHFDGPIQAP